MARQRDYRAEYKARIQRGLDKGTSRSQARGHGRKLDAPRYDRKVEKALQAFRQTHSLTKSARLHHVSAERLRRYARENRVVRKVRGKWQFLRDRRLRDVPLYTAGEFRKVTVIGFDAASKAFQYMADVGRFMDTNNVAFLTKWDGQGIDDSLGRWVPFETRPNVIYRLAALKKEPFEQIYRIVI